MTEHKSDLPAASVGFFGGAIVVAAILYFISAQTTKKFAGHSAEAGAAPAAAHKQP